MNSQLLLAQAARFLQSGNIPQAELMYMQALAADPANAPANHMLGVLRSQQGRHTEALELIAKALTINARSAPVLSNYGNVLRALGRFDEALASFNKAIELDPSLTMLHCNRGSVLKDLGRLDEALLGFNEALAINPRHVEALYGRGLVLWKMNRREEALQSYDATLNINPHLSSALYNRGLVLAAMERFAEAVESYDKALAIKPDFSEAWNNRGNALRDMKRFEDALASYDAVLKLKPRFAEGLNNRGIALWNLNRFEEALKCFDTASAIKPDYAEALNHRGVTLGSLKRLEEALASLDAAVAIDADSTDALYNRGEILRSLKRFDEAFESYNRILMVDPEHSYALGGAANALLNICGWPQTKQITNNIQTHVREGVIPPFTLLGYCDDPALQLQCAMAYIKNKIPRGRYRLWNGKPYNHDKIRIAYLSSDLQEHATAFLMANIFELHDRSRFDVAAYSYGLDDGSTIRSRLVGAFDSFHDVHAKSDYDVAMMLKSNEIDIAIDLKGHTQDGRIGILSYRPCPVQVSYLGYPGTLGADFIDYVIADRIVVPFDQQPFFTEKIVHLPDSYQANDSRRVAAERTPPRGEVGLPDRGFVFCCFNNSWKIAAPIFEVWMRLLKVVPDSVLWLIEDNSGASMRLQNEALSRGVDPQRLIFAPRLPLDKHLARHRLADLFLDTLPYNAHTTASDALFAGIPIVTSLGNCFAGRVAASLLQALDLSELITRSLQQYEDLARQIALQPGMLQSLKGKLERNRTNSALFDSDRFRKNIEAALFGMWSIVEHGECPRSFSVNTDG